jgi:hypothetical protein
MENPMIQTPKGNGELNKIYISELGFLMLKIYYKNGTFITYNLGKHKPEDNIFTNKIMEYEKQEN